MTLQKSFFSCYNSICVVIIPIFFKFIVRHLSHIPFVIYLIVSILVTRCQFDTCLCYVCPTMGLLNKFKIQIHEDAYRFATLTDNEINDLLEENNSY